MLAKPTILTRSPNQRRSCCDYKISEFQPLLSEWNLYSTDEFNCSRWLCQSCSDTYTGYYNSPIGHTSKRNRAEISASYREMGHICLRFNYREDCTTLQLFLRDLAFELEQIRAQVCLLSEDQRRQKRARRDLCGRYRWQ